VRAPPNRPAVARTEEIRAELLAARTPAPVTLAGAAMCGPVTEVVPVVAVAWGSTVRQPEQVAEPPGVVTVTFTAPVAPCFDTFTDTEMLVADFHVVERTVMSGSENDTVALSVKPVPVRVSLSFVVPFVTDEGVTEVSVGVGAAATVTLLLIVSVVPNWSVTVVVAV
jgi:hypothetical protein